METLKLLLNRTPSIVIEAFFLYFSFLKKTKVNIENIHSEKNFSNDELLVPIKYIKVMSDAACYNQGAFTQYWFLAALRHKRIRKELDKKDIDIRYLRELSNDLMKFLNQSFHKAALKNFDYIHRYFEGRSKISPRISLAGYSNINGVKTIITLFCNKDCEPPTPIESNSGFEYILKNGKYYFSNNLYKEAIEGRYKNPRLELNKLQEPRTIMHFFNTEARWKNCWKTLSDKRADNYYTSTLIVPMTFWNNSLDKEFLDKLDIFPESKRTIFGFVCVEHQDKNYFKEESDASVLYFFADALSQYVFSRLVYTKISHTKNKLEALLDGDSLDAGIDNITEQLKRENFFQPIAIRESVTEINKSSEEENFTYEVDPYLRKYIDKLRNVIP